MFDQQNSTSLTLADVVDLLIALPDIDETQRRDMVSAIKRTSKILGCAPSDLPAAVPALRARILTIEPKTVGLQPRSWANVKSSLARALETVGLVAKGNVGPRTQDWSAVLGEAPEPHHRYQIARLADYCSALNIEPKDLSDQTIAEFYLFLDQTLLTRDPFIPVKDTVDAWNIVSRCARPDLVALTPYRKGRYIARGLDVYPEGMQKEIEAYLKRLAVEDLFDETGPLKALRPTSLRNVRAHLRQYLDALVTSGREQASLSDLRDALKIEDILAACRVISDRNDGKVSTGLPNILATLLALGRHQMELPPDWISAVKRLRARVGEVLGASDMAMSPKSVERLAQFDDPRNVAAIVSLPEMLLKRAKRAPERKYAPLDAMRATAIAILLSCPMRAQNLAALDIQKHLRKRKDGRHSIYSIRIEGDEVKNEIPIEVDLGVEVSQILHEYIAKFRPSLVDVPSSALFPKRASGRARTSSNLSQDLTAAIRRETGLVVHAHLFRHLAAKLFLDLMPGEYETVRRFLGHKKLETTVQFYARLTAKKAHERYDDVVLAPMRGRKGS